MSMEYRVSMDTMDFEEAESFEQASDNSYARCLQAEKTLIGEFIYGLSAKTGWSNSIMNESALFKKLCMVSITEND